MQTAIYLRRRLKVTPPEEPGVTSLALLATMQKNLESFGFLLSDELLQRLAATQQDVVLSFYSRLVRELGEMVGAHRRFEPMYPGFPQQVMETHEAELYLRALLHYITGARPQSDAVTRPPLAEPAARCRVIHLGDQADFDSLFTLLAKSKSPYSEADRTDVKWFLTAYGRKIGRLLPEEIPSRENAAVIVAGLLRGAADGASLAERYVKTATDVLRIAVALSDGDPSLADPSPFKRLNRRERVLFLGWLERTGDPLEDMLRWKPRWIRLGEKLHPGEYAKRFPKTAEAFDVLRNNRPSPTFHGRVERHLAAHRIPEALDLLATRPGELARRLDHLTRSSSNPDAVVERFAFTANSVSTPVLLQAMTHFRGRSAPTARRSFFPKGQVASVYVVDKPLPALSTEAASQLAAICERTLVARFAQLAPLGKCYLDPQLKNYLAPFSQRSASKSLRTLVRGSRLPLPQGNTLRFFVWWKNGAERTDVDLAAAVYDEGYRYLDVISYYNLKNYGGCHSGDIVDAPQGAAEFIDLDRQRCREQGVRYIVMSLHSYTQQPYCDLPECFAGWMSRSQPNSGEIFEPRTVVDKVDVASDTQICLPAIFDLARDEVIWADVALRRRPHWGNNTASNLRGVSLMLQAMTQLRKLDLHALFSLHIAARGEPVSDVNEADTVFAPDRGLTPFDVDRIAAEFM